MAMTYSKILTLLTQSDIYRENEITPSKAVAHAMEKFPRRDFIPGEQLHLIVSDSHGGVTSEGEISVDVLADADIPIPISMGRFIPSISHVAFLIDLLELEPGMQIRELGTGTGYVTALLSSIVGTSGFVISSEPYDLPYEGALEAAKKRLCNGSCGNISLLPPQEIMITSSGLRFDRVVYSGSADLPLEIGIEHLAEKFGTEGCGIAVIPHKDGIMKYWFHDGVFSYNENVPVKRMPSLK